VSDSSYFVGVDVGTAGCRVSVYASNGQLAVSAASSYALYTPRPGWVEQDPDEIFVAFRTALNQALAEFPLPRTRIRALALGTTLHSIFPVSSEGHPLHRMLNWTDTRAEPYLRDIRSALDAQALYARTGCPLHAMYPLAKLVWFRRERPDLFEKAAKFVSIKEYLVYRLTGRFAADRSVASATGYFDLRRMEWDTACLDVMGIDADRLAPHFSTVETIHEWPAAAFGLPAATPLVLGAGDGVLSSLGAAAVGPNQYTVMIGTSGAVRRCVPVPTTDADVKNWCYNLTDALWVAGGAINNGGLALQWVKDSLLSESYENLDAIVQRVPAGSNGLLFLPFLSGERSPHWNSNARGVIFGLTLNHTKADLVRATLEGVAFSLYSVFVRLRQLASDDDTAPIELRASGSFTRSAAWLQIVADVFGLAVACPSEPEGSAFGAAVLGMIATGELLGPAAVSGITLPPRSISLPTAETHADYQELFRLYERVYANLVQDFDAISAFQISHAREQ